MKDPSAKRKIKQKTYDQKWNHCDTYVEKSEYNGRKVQPKMNNDLKATQNVLSKRKTEEILNFLSRNCAKPQPPRVLRPTAAPHPHRERASARWWEGCAIHMFCVRNVNVAMSTFINQKTVLIPRLRDPALRFTPSFLRDCVTQRCVWRRDCAETARPSAAS